MSEPLDIRTFSWLRPNLSWAFVIYNLINAFDKLGHNTYALSTNGMDEKYFDVANKASKSIAGLEPFNRGDKNIFLDFCYTVPNNYSKRFLPNSINKAIIYNYETNIMPDKWKGQYDYVDFHFPSSNFCAEVFYRNGVPENKIFVVPHGVDRNRFNSSVPPIKLKTKKSFKFLSVTAPHYRKNIDILLNAYCQAFTNKDDVCLVLKTKVFKHSDGIFDEQKNPGGRKGYELVLGDLFKPLVKKYGKNMPEIEIIGGHVDNPASIYNACNVHVSATGSEGYGMIFTEAMSCGLYNIAGRYSGHLDFLNDNNSLLVDTKLRKAKNVEQYWGYSPKAVISYPIQSHLSQMMAKAYKEHSSLLDKFSPKMESVVNEHSWENAAQLMLDICDGKVSPYAPGTYRWWPK